jgi:hypothetical protein
VVNIALLSTHQADAVFWREWDVFGVPRALPLFLVFNAAVMTLLEQGLVVAIASTSSAQAWVTLRP